MVKIGGSRALAVIFDDFRQQVIDDVIQYRIDYHTYWSKSADEKYTDAWIALMAKSLHHPSFSFKIIKSDIFQNELYKDGSMCFSKLRRDMLK